ncbi:MAG: hypothetical protein LBJ00_08920 [Planctomycetaceae bacterium]|jgi:hypothetical protein|nr:hypothetical protein [Planctomycetaceae bacterium]
MSRIDQVIIEVQVVRGGNCTAEVAAATDGVRNADVREVVEWFSGGGSQTCIQFDRENIFFHPLPYGDFAIGVINFSDDGIPKPVWAVGIALEQPLRDAALACSASGILKQLEYTCSGISFFVRVFIISPSVFLQYANNPVAVYESLLRGHYVTEVTEPLDKLNPITVLPEQKICDVEILRRLVTEAGSVAISRLFQSLLDSVCTIFRPYNSMSSLFILDGIFNLLPIRFRSGLTFSTELFLSPVNPLQAVGFCGESDLAVKLAEESGALLIDFERFDRYQNPPQNVCLGQWSKLVLQILSDGDFAFWQYQIEADAESCDDMDEFVNWQDLNDLAIIWQRRRPKKPIVQTACASKTGESAERGIEQSMTAVEMLLAEVKGKPAS